MYLWYTNNKGIVYLLMHLNNRILIKLMNTVIDTHTVCKSTEANKTVLEHLKIDFKEVESKRSKTKYLKLYRRSEIFPDNWEMIEELNRWRVENFIDYIVLK